MASKSATNTGLPEGFESPFKRVQMIDRNGDSLACVATLTGKTIEEVNKAAVELGLPARGPYFVDGVMIAKLLMRLGGLVATNYKEFHSYDALPPVAILLVEYNPDTEVGMHVCWHHVKAHGDISSFSYLIDVADWIDPKQHYNKMLEKYQPAYYVEVSAPPAKAKAK